MAGERGPSENAVEHIVRNVVSLIVHDINLTLMKQTSELKELREKVERFEDLLRKVVRGEDV